MYLEASVLATPEMNCQWLSYCPKFTLLCIISTRAIALFRWRTQFSEERTRQGPLVNLMRMEVFCVVVIFRELSFFIYTEQTSTLICAERATE
jgi:hypothetical protein